MCMIDSVLLYRSQCDAMRNLPPENFKEAVLAVWDYAMDGADNPSDPIAAAVLGLVKPLIDARNKKVEAGSKGGNKTKSERKQSGSTLEANWKQGGITLESSEEQPGSTLEAKEVKYKEVKYKEKKNKDIKEKENIPFGSIIDYLNQKAGTAYRVTSENTKRHIRARWNEKYTLEDFYKVIDNKVAEWKGSDMEKFLRPETLFGTKFEGYLNGKAGGKPVKKKNSFNNFHQREYDWDALERSLMK